ncbi:putative cysteine desulfurase 2 [Candidatus Micrarchaeum sp.]|uniref:aminotransferase class V-fold PLP-dependent enzyme n=1 Tax=Candidatus Micrarchaeum sp. TaxID=2282148 RepID=UPI000929F06F|nr:cysteine desulfurase [Candidatus Micrarchaeum sp.]OJI07068.1 MAG: cysteine desulfurase [Candidatus Micrarchaeum sp. ARMAN-1]OJT94480.1 MAG: cysteine desulfurase [Candidatus Micrarchaeum sp. AZ1]OWP53823.1 MAG: cysteine desulfurase [Thermoplasmatales archaeon ARMAN]QRF73503.1 putative cysteine desulfurase 2 [Candidatus Micrarchaeum sp.]
MVNIDSEEIKKDFPIFESRKDGQRLVYLDSAATSQKPRAVINAISDYYSNYNANIHRGVYQIAERATEAYENSKKEMAKFLGAESYEELVYVRNTTEAINLVALSWGEKNISEGDHILISEMEHHSNLVPWILLAKRKKAVLDYIKVGEDYRLDQESLENGLEKNPKLVAITHASNVLGTINDVKSITKKAHDKGAVVLVDGAQSAPHMPVNLSDIGCDFYALSGHKMLGPTGIGALYGKREILEAMPPVIGGGDMIETVEFYSCTWNRIPWKFEAGTSNIEGGIGMTPAIQYLQKLGMENIFKHEVELTKYALDALAEIKNVETYGPDMKKNDHGGVISFSVNGVHPHDIASIFDNYNVAIRAGHHCAMPLVTQILRQSAVARMSFYIYNNKDDIDKAVEAINEVKRIFKK